MRGLRGYDAWARNVEQGKKGREAWAFGGASEASTHRESSFELEQMLGKL